MSFKLVRIKEFMIFSKSERNGIIVLIFIIFLLAVIPSLYRSLLITPFLKSTQTSAAIDSFFLQLKLKPVDSLPRSDNLIESEELKLPDRKELFFFDPNKVSIEDLVRLGFSIKQAQVIDRFRNKGGRFRVLDDFAKVYVVDSSIFLKLKPWIRIDSSTLTSTVKKSDYPTETKELKHLVIELNSVDTLELVKIKGIGKAFARRIVNYRDLLGGYANLQQLSEVYGINPELIGKISEFIIIDTTRIRTLNLNLVTYEELRKHPYISEYQAKAIIYYRSKVGTITKLEELIDSKILLWDKYLKLKIYFSLN